MTKSQLQEKLFDLISARQHTTGEEREELTAKIRQLQAILDRM